MISGGTALGGYGQAYVGRLQFGLHHLFAVADFGLRARHDVSHLDIQLGPRVYHD